jgi:hypothetical protein
MLYGLQKIVGTLVSALAPRDTLGTVFHGAAALRMSGMIEAMIDEAHERASIEDYNRAEDAALGSRAVKSVFEQFNFQVNPGTLTKPEPLEQTVGRRKMEYAAMVGNPDRIRELLAEGISPHDPTLDKSGALDAALLHGQLECIQVLRDAGAIPFGPQTENLMLMPAPWTLRPEIEPVSNTNSPELIAIKKDIIHTLPHDVQQRYFPAHAAPAPG